MTVPCNVAHLPTHFCVSSISTASGLGQSSDVGDEDSPSTEHSTSPAGRGRRGCWPWPHSARRPGPSPSLWFGGHVRPLGQLSFVVWKPLLSCFQQLFLQVRFGDFWFVWVFVVCFFFKYIEQSCMFSQYVAHLEHSSREPGLWRSDGFSSQEAPFRRGASWLSLHQW